MDFIIEETEFNGQPVDAARTLLRDKAGELMTQALRWHDARRTGMTGTTLGEILTPRNAIRSTTGTGKSEQLRQAIPYYVREAKPKDLPHRLLIAVPTHKLAKEAQDKMPGGVTTHVWQGRGGKHLVTKEPMCRNLEAVDAALEIGTDVENVACKRKQAQCPFYTSCHYQAQKPAAAKAEIVYVAHETLFNMPEALGDGFGLVIIDEAFWQDGLDSRAKLAISGLALELDAFPVRDHGWKSHDFTWQLRELIGQLQHALDQMDDGYVTRQPLVDAGLTAEDMRRRRQAGMEAQGRSRLEARRTGRAAEAGRQAVRLPRPVACARGDVEGARRPARLERRRHRTAEIETTTTKEGSTRWLRINRPQGNRRGARQPADHRRRRHPAAGADALLPAGSNSRSIS